MTADDPFGTRATRDRVLAGWSASAARFREDANAEEDQALGGYRDRLIVELAQNAADAATRGGVPGRLLLALHPDGVPGLPGPTLVAANTGAPLDTAGVLALATLRASAKRAPSDADPEVDADPAADVDPAAGPAPVVGRFGVGFCAVLAVTDDPRVLSRAPGTGVTGVSFSRRATADLVRASGSPDLVAELDRRSGHVPVLRLPFAVPDADPALIPVGYDTAVVLPLRDPQAERLTRRLLAEVGDPLLLALPALTEVTVELDGARRVVREVDSRWITVRRNGFHAPEALGERPTEERGRSAWTITWALPRQPGAQAPGGGVVWAPTPTDEPLALPALLLAPFPLDPSRRHVAPGPATQALAGEAGAAYAELVAAAVRQTPWRAWDLVPTGFPAGAVDAAVREAAVPALAHAPVLTLADPDPDPDGADASRPLVCPRDAVALTVPDAADGALAAALAPSVAGLVVVPRDAEPAAAVLGLARLPLADVLEQLPDRDPAAWHALYAALGAALSPRRGDPAVREALAAMPVPLADGRLVRGARGAVLAGPGAPVEALTELGVRVVHPAAAHDLLEHAGAQLFSPSAVLAGDAVRATVRDGLRRAEDGEPTHSGAVLALVATALAAGERVDPDPLRALALTDDTGESAPAAELVLPGSLAADVFDPDVLPPVAAHWVDTWGPEVLAAAGVLRRPMTVTHELATEDDLAELDDADGWVADLTARVGAAPELTELVAVRDLDAVGGDGWPVLLAALATDPDLRDVREAVIRPVRVIAPGHRPVTAPSYAAWWLRRHLAGGLSWARAPLPGLGAVLPPPPPAVRACADRLDDDLCRALGGVTSMGDLDVATTLDVLAALADTADAGGAVPLPTVLGLYRHLAGLAADAAGHHLPERLPAVRTAAPPRTGVRAGSVVGAGADEAVVVDHPAWLQLVPLAVPVPAGLGPGLAELLDLDLATRRHPGRLDDDPAVPAQVPDAVRSLLPDAPAVWLEHEVLRVDGIDVDWWVQGEGESARVHATTTRGLARGLAQAAGRWPARDTVAEVLAPGADVTEVLLDDAVG